MTPPRLSAGPAKPRKRALFAPPRASLPDITDENEALIQASIANDPDNPEITDAQATNLRPASEVLPPTFYAKLVARGRPRLAATKVPVTLRLDAEIVAAFKSTGKGWQTRINEVLRRGMPR